MLLEKAGSAAAAAAKSSVEEFEILASSWAE